MTLESILEFCSTFFVTLFLLQSSLLYDVGNIISPIFIYSTYKSLKSMFIKHIIRSRKCYCSSCGFCTSRYGVMSNNNFARVRTVNNLIIRISAVYILIKVYSPLEIVGGIQLSFSMVSTVIIYTYAQSCRPGKAITPIQ